MNWLKWLTPGLKVKRWLLLLFVGVTITCLGVAVAFDVPYFNPHFAVADFLFMYTKQYVSPTFSGAVIGATGLLLIVLGFRGSLKSIASALSPDASQPLIDVIYKRRQLEQGPRVVAIGGGTGLPAVLRGLKEYTSNITAVVTVTDDGGSSGRLRELGFPPPGDIRNCIVALSDVEQLMQELLQYRFQGMGEGLDGHCFGNLLIAAMVDITGDFDRAVKETSKVLSIRGQVLPATLENVILCAELQDSQVVRGQVQVGQAPTRIRRAFLEPEHPRALPEAVTAIQEADVIVIGPGSLFSSIIPNLLVREIRDAVRGSKAPKVYICNVMTQPNETRGFRNASDHLKALIQHAGPNIVDYMLLNRRRPSEDLVRKYLEEGAEFVQPDVTAVERLGVRALLEDLITEEEVVRHDSHSLGSTVFRILDGARHLTKVPAQKETEQAQVAA